MPFTIIAIAQRDINKKQTQTLIFNISYVCALGTHAYGVSRPYAQIVLNARLYAGTVLPFRKTNPHAL